MSTPKFAETHNLVAFLEKPEESNGFEGIIDFLNASSIKYALMVNPIVYESCIQQFWATAKAKTHLEGGVKFLMFPRFVQVFLDKQVEGLTRHKDVYVTPSHTKKVFANMKRPGKEDMGEDSAAPSDSHSIPIISQPSSSKPQKKKSRRKQRKDGGSIDHVTAEAYVSTLSYDPP
ncbi:hypothetical protein Tco_1372708 [Tanacetum coccineum]